MASRLVVPLAVLALTAAACSGGDETADTTPATQAPTTSATTAPPTTSAPVTTTTAAPTTTSPAPTAPPTVPPTTPAPTAPVVTASTLPLPTPDGFTLEEVQAIDRDFREGYGRYYAALADPRDEQLVQAALDYTVGFETEDFGVTIDLFRTNNRRVEQLPAPPVSFEILQGPTRLPNPGEVGLSLCHVAPFVTFDTAPDGTQTFVNDNVVTQLLTIELRLEGGVWKRVGQFLEGQWDGVVRCQDVS